MRRIASIGVALLLSGCGRQQYTTTTAPAPVPARSGSGRVVAPMPPVVVSPANADVVPYIITRGMTVPVAGVTVPQLRDTFDEGRTGGRVHRALDILAPRGTPVLSADSGRILRIGENALGGNTIFASDPIGRVVYYYAHLDGYQPGLFQGSVVARGDTLGFVGTTGNAPKDTPHLHFQVMRMPSDGKFWDGDAINPYPLFLLMRQGGQRP